MGRGLTELPGDQGLVRRPENKRNAVNDPASKKVDLDQALSEFSSEEGLGGHPKNGLADVDLDQALSEFSSEKELGGCQSSETSILDSPQSPKPRVTSFYPQSLSPGVGEPRSVVSSAPPTRTSSAAWRLNVALATVAALLVGAIGAWWMGLEPKRTISTGQIGPPIASNQPSVTAPAQAKGLGMPAPRPAIASGGPNSLEAPVTPSPSSKPTALDRVSSSIPPATSPAPPRVTPTQDTARANRDQKRTGEGADLSLARTSDARTLAGKSPPSIGAESAIHTPEPGATDPLRSGSSLSPPHGPAAAPSVEAVSPPSVNDAAAVRDVLARYRVAYEHLDARSAKQIWPSVDERALARAFDGLESQAVTFESCNVVAGDGRAIASCRGNATYVRRVGNKSLQAQSREWTFMLRRAADGWLIQAVQTR
jgi:hypothetical protein